MIRFGTLGAARITPRALLYPCMDEPRANVVAIAARDRGRAERFAEFASIGTVLDDYDALVGYDGIDAVYNPLPITAHKEWTIKALKAGKHVLCEKSFSANAAEAREMADVARETGLVVMDAFHYRYHPLFVRAKAIVESGELGEIRHVEANFAVPGEGIASDDIRKVYGMGGGVTMDIGCYPLSFVRHLTGEEPRVDKAIAEVGPPRVDLMLRAEMSLSSGATAIAIGDMRDGARFRADITVEGSAGTMHVVNPLVPQNGHRLTINLGGETRNETFDRRPTYCYQLDAFLDAIGQGKPLLTGPDDAVRQMELIDRCYEAAGLPLRGL